MSHTWIPLRGRLLSFAVAAACALPALVPQAKAAPLSSSITQADSAEVLEAAKHIYDSMLSHQARLERIELALQGAMASGDSQTARMLEHLKAREIRAFREMISEYQRLLGQRAFTRVVGAIRERMATGGSQSSVLSRVSRARPTVVSLRAGELSSTNPATRFKAEAQRAAQRKLIETRMQQAQSRELRLVAQQQRSIQPFAARPNPTMRGAGRAGAAAAGRNAGMPGASVGTPYTRPGRR